MRIWLALIGGSTIGVLLSSLRNPEIELLRQALESAGIILLLWAVFEDGKNRRRRGRRG